MGSIYANAGIMFQQQGKRFLRIQLLEGPPTWYEPFLVGFLIMTDKGAEQLEQDYQKELHGSEH